MKYIRLLILVIVIFSVVIGLNFQDITNTDSSLTDSTEIVEVGGKIITANIHDGIEGSLGNG